MEKKQIRKLIFEKRKSQDPEALREKSHRICQKVIAHPFYQKADAIYLYMDCKGEASTEELFSKALEDGKRVAAPKVFGEEMRFFYLTSKEDLEPGYFGIPEPKEGLTEATEEQALVIVPGVAFDRERHRCGYGKGFYDRYLKRHPSMHTIAIALDDQIVPEVPADEFDVTPQVLITPDEVL